MTISLLCSCHNLHFASDVDWRSVHGAKCFLLAARPREMGQWHIWAQLPVVSFARSPHTRALAVFPYPVIRSRNTCVSPKSVIRGEQVIPCMSDLLVHVSCLALWSAKSFLRSTTTLSCQNIFNLTLFREHGFWSSVVLVLFCGLQIANLCSPETLSSFKILDSGVICTS